MLSNDVQIITNDVQYFGHSGMPPWEFSAECRRMSTSDSDISEYFRRWYEYASNREKGKKRERGKKFYNYLLIDPRRMMALRLLNEEYLSNNPFLLTHFGPKVFYVGKGCSNRAYSHLKEARRHERKKTRSESRKVNTIRAIWRSGDIRDRDIWRSGVVVLRLNQNLSNDEALVREGLIMHALRRSMGLTNIQHPIFRKHLIHWADEDKSMVGTYLVWKAIQVYIDNRESSFRIGDF
jgi:hypothetical protein